MAVLLMIPLASPGHDAAILTAFIQPAKQKQQNHKMISLTESAQTKFFRIGSHYALQADYLLEDSAPSGKICCFVVLSSISYNKATGDQWRPRRSDDVT
jgi:hypothetical protein